MKENLKYDGYKEVAQMTDEFEKWLEDEGGK